MLRPFPFNPRLVVPSTFGECLTYEEQMLFLAKKIAELTDAVNALEARVETLEGGAVDNEVTPRV
jgi:hypothetical protein